jgi:hypothetical protein
MVGSQWFAAAGGRAILTPKGARYGNHGHFSLYSRLVALVSTALWVSARISRIGLTLPYLSNFEPTSTQMVASNISNCTA